MMERLCADSVEKHEPVSDIDTAVVDGLKALDPNRPIREADIARNLSQTAKPANNLSANWHDGLQSIPFRRDP
jgi:hypothetical protein